MRRVVHFRGREYELVTAHLDDLARTDVYEGDELLFGAPGVLGPDAAPAALAAYQAGREAGESALRERLAAQALRAMSCVNLQPLSRMARIETYNQEPAKT